jgi:hypothetical protein
MSDLETPHPRTKAEERIRLDAHPEQFRDEEVAELVDIDRNTEDENDGEYDNYKIGHNQQNPL